MRKAAPLYTTIGCETCHGDEGHGSAVGPSLATDSLLRVHHLCPAPDGHDAAIHEDVSEVSFSILSHGPSSDVVFVDPYSAKYHRHVVGGCRRG